MPWWWTALGVLIVCGLLVKLLRILRLARSTPEVIDHKIHPLPSAHYGGLVPEEDEPNGTQETGPEGRQPDHRGEHAERDDRDRGPKR
jgi:hypothetical protein